MTESQGWIVIGLLIVIGSVIAWELALIGDRLTDLREAVRRLK